MGEFVKENSMRVNVQGTIKKVNYDSAKQIGIAISWLGTSKAIALGAYSYALNVLDSKDIID